MKRFRVRGEDRPAIEALEMALRLSPTVQRLADELECSDVIVLIETGWLPANLTGQVRLLSATAGNRYLRVTLRIPNVTRALVRTLGHELQHAVEIARMPGITTDKRLAQAYKRAGFAAERGGFYETVEARQIHRMVARELAAK